MATRYRKAGDTNPLTATLRYKGGQPIPLSGSSVLFLADPAIEGIGSALSKACEVLDAAKGRVSMTPEENELPADAVGPATYKIEFEVTLADGTKLTVPERDYEYLVIEADLN